MKAFNCAVWIDTRDLSRKAAAKHFDALLEGKIPQEFDRSVYAFFTDLTRRFPEPDEFTDEEMDGCPWACALENSGESVIMALLPDRHIEVFPVILELADKYGLVCFDAQNTIVHLPSHPGTGQEWFECLGVTRGSRKLDRVASSTGWSLLAYRSTLLNEWDRLFWIGLSRVGRAGEAHWSSFSRTQ